MVGSCCGLSEFVQSWAVVPKIVNVQSLVAAGAEGNWKVGVGDGSYNGWVAGS
jgi:hypothetical protein